MTISQKLRVVMWLRVWFHVTTAKSSVY